MADSHEAETMLPCPACKGSKSILHEDANGRYNMRPCRWCKGSGCVALKTMRKFIRWRRLLARNLGKCRK